MKTHKDLIVWQKSIDLVELIYKLSKTLPNSERYGLANQIQRAAVSIPSNIAEGAARQSKKEFIRFLYISLGSTSELETQFLLIKRLHLIEELPSALLNEIKMMLLGLIKSLRINS